MCFVFPFILSYYCCPILEKGRHAPLRRAFDVELLYIARRFQMAVSEVAVTWHEVDGSKLVPVFSWAQMGRDLLLLRLRYMVGAWRLELHPKID